MVVIRLARGGKRKHPFYRIVAADKRFPRDGRHLEILGYYNPMARGGETKLHVESGRVKYWLGVGAQPSESVTGLLKKFEKMAAADPAA